MSMNLTPEKFSCEPEYLLAGTDIRVTTAVKKAAAALKAGAPVKLDSSGKAAPWQRQTVRPACTASLLRISNPARML